jgi:hypothetical protein
MCKLKNSQMSKHYYPLSIAVLASIIINLSAFAQMNYSINTSSHSGRQVYTWQNPFIQPLQISDFYGSGDVNSDGVIDIADHELLLQIIANQYPENIRCDVDGNGVINITDKVILLDNIQNGTPLPSSWNFMPNNIARTEWIQKMLSIDKVDEFIYEYYYYQCLNTSHELYFQFTQYLSDVYYNPIFPLNTVYNGGQSIYNLPVYIVIISSPELNHAINCILVGDDPLNFSDWLFFEPVNDQIVLPNTLNLSIGSNIYIDAINTPTAEVNTYHRLVKFTVGESGFVLSEYNPELVLTRPTPEAIVPENKIYQWYPNLLVNDSAYILYDQMRDDMTRRTDIFIKNTQTGESVPITMMDETSLLLDYVAGEGGNIHLLFSCRQTKKPGVYYGIYNINSRTFTQVKRISDLESRVVPSGKLILNEEEVNAFWFLSPFYNDMPAPGGIYYNHCSGGIWSSEELVFPINYPVFSLSFLTQSIFPYLMEGTLLNDGNVLLVTQSVNNESLPGYSDIVFIKSNGSDWAIDSLNYPLDYSGVIRSMDMTYDGNRLDLVFTNPWSWSTNEDPAICHVISDDNGQSWHGLTIIDSSPVISDNNVFTAPRLIRHEESLYLTYINRDDPSKIVWRKYENNQWQFKNYIELPQNQYPWFPQIDFLPSNELLFAWSNSSEGRIDLKQQKINCNLGAPAKPSGPDSIPVYTTTQYATNSINDATLYEWVLTPAQAGSVTDNDTTATITWQQGFNGEAFLKVRAYNGCSEGNYSEELPINVTVDVKTLSNDLSSIRIYPNPVSDFLFIDNNNPGKEIEYRIISSIGKSIASGEFKDDYTISTTTLPAGIYLLNLRRDNYFSSFKFMVK